MAFQRTTIRPSIPGSGKDAASASTASRAARERRRQVWIVTVASARRHVPTISPSTRRAPGQTRGVQSAPTTVGVGDQEFAIGSLEEEVRVAAREEPCGRRGPRGRAERRLVAGEDPRVADRRSHRGQRPAERVERLDASPLGDPRPLGERLGRGGTEDVQVPARELEARVARVDLGWRHGPDGRQPRAVPPDQDRAGRCGVPEPVGVYAERAPGLAVGHPPPPRCACRRAARSSATRRAPAFVRQPPEREDREIARRDDVRVVPRSPELDERRILPGGRLGPLDARVDREERGSGHAVLQAGPRRTPERAPSAREPLVERADVPPEREDLRPREVEPRRRHVTRRSTLSRAMRTTTWAVACDTSRRYFVDFFNVTTTPFWTFTL